MKTASDSIVTAGAGLVWCANLVALGFALLKDVTPRGRASRASRPGRCASPARSSPSRTAPCLICGRCRADEAPHRGRGRAVVRVQSLAPPPPPPPSAGEVPALSRRQRCDGPACNDVGDAATAPMILRNWGSGQRRQRKRRERGRRRRATFGLERLRENELLAAGPVRRRRMAPGGEHARSLAGTYRCASIFARKAVAPAASTVGHPFLPVRRKRPPLAVTSHSALSKTRRPARRRDWRRSARPGAAAPGTARSRLHRLEVLLAYVRILLFDVVVLFVIMMDPVEIGSRTSPVCSASSTA